jgi:hypothetical protein
MGISKAEHCAQILVEPPVNRIDFMFGSVHVSRDQFAKVARALRAGQISVRGLAAGSKGPGDYNADGPRRDSIELKPMTEGDFADSKTRGLIVHEAVHAMIDLNKWTITRLGGESAAFLAQVLYRLLRDGGKYRDLAHSPGSDGDDKDAAAIRNECLSVIKKLGLDWSCGIVPTPCQDAITKAVHSHPKYRGILSTAMHPADGLRRKR